VTFVVGAYSRLCQILFGHSELVELVSDRLVGASVRNPDSLILQLWFEQVLSF